MSRKFAKFAAASVAALTLVAGVAATSTEAQARRGWGIAAGIAAGALIAGAAASHAYGHGYYVGPGYTKCKFVPRYDYWGNYMGAKKVCYVY